MAGIKFLRTGTRRHKRLGRNDKKKQRWRRPKGIHSKIRENKKSKQKKVKIGYRGERADRGKINGKIPVFVRNLEDAEKVKQGDCVIIGKVGRKKRIEIEKKVLEKKGSILNQKGDLK